MPITTIQELENRLRQPGTLSTILPVEDFAAEQLVADSMARQFKETLKPTQMRKVFHTFKNIERRVKTHSLNDPLPQDVRTEIALLLPNLAYAVGRKMMPEPFYNVLKLCLKSEKLSTIEDFLRLNQLLTAILAYQKFWSEKEKKNND